MHTVVSSDVSTKNPTAASQREQLEKTFSRTHFLLYGVDCIGPNVTSIGQHQLCPDIGIL